MVNIMTQATFTQCNFVSFFCSCEAFFPAWVNVQENLSLHRPARSKNQFNAQHWWREQVAIRMPTWTIPQCFHQNIKLEASVKTSSSKILKAWTTTTPWASSSGQLKAAGAYQARVGRFLQQICQVKRKFIFIQLLMEKKYIKKFDDSAKNFKPLSEEEHGSLQSSMEQHVCKIK